MVEEAQHHRELISKMLKKMSQREVLGAFTKWQEVVDEAHNARAAAARAIGFFFTSATRGAFIAFQRNVVYEKTMRKAAQFFIGGSKAKFLKQWKDNVDDTVYVRGLMAKAAMAFAGKAKDAAWHGWKAVVVRRRKNRDFIAKALVFYAYSIEGKTWRKWVEVTQEAKELNRKLANAVAKMQNRALGGSFNRWVEYVDEVVDMREKLNRAVARFSMRAAAAAFSTWVQVKDVEMERRRILLEHVAKKFNRTKGFIFDQWRKWVDFELNMKTILEKAMRLMMNRTIAAAWARWLEKMEESRMIQRAMRKFIYAAQGQAFTTWVEYTNEVQLMRKIAQAIGYANDGLLQRCMDKWCVFVDAVKDERKAYKAAVLKFFGSIKQTSFKKWTKYTYTMLRVKQIMGNGLKRFCKQGMRAWHEEATVSKFLRTQSEFLQANTSAGVRKRAFVIWLKIMKCDRHRRLKSLRAHFREWTFHLGLRKEDKRREEKLAIVLKKMMFGNMANVFAGWRLIILRNKRFFRKQAAIKLAIASGDALIRSKKRALYLAAWRAWKASGKQMGTVRNMLVRALRRAQGTYFARWWSYVEHRRAKLEKFSSAKVLHQRLLLRSSFTQWIDAQNAGAAEMDAKLAKAMQMAFGNSIAFVVSKWRGLVQDEKQKKMAMQRLVGLLAGCQLENLGVHVIHGWRDVVRQSRLGTAHLRKADNHRQFKIMDSCFLAWKVIAAPLTQFEHNRLLDRGMDAWDRDFDDKGDSAEVHAQVLARRVRSMFDGRDPDEDDDDGHVEEIRKKAPTTGMRGVLSRAAAIAASGAPKGAQGGTVDLGSDSDDDEPPSSKGVGGRATSVVPQSAIAPKAKGGGFCAECGASYDRAGQKFCMECGAKA